MLGLLAALGTVLARNLVHAALFLVAFFFIVACQFVMLEAEFLAAVQVLVYIGAVAILLMFGIMLTRNVQGDDTTSVPRGWIVPAWRRRSGCSSSWPSGSTTTSASRRGKRLVGDGPPAAGRRGARRAKSPSAADPGGQRHGRTVGDEMLTRYAVPFEVAGLMLTAALVGRRRPGPPRRRGREPPADGAARAAAGSGDGRGRRVGRGCR